MKNRETFGRFGALMAMAGSAVGLGNMWRFPYLLGENGGAAFLVIYLLCSFTLALPIFFAECVVGRRGSSNCIGCYRKLAPGTKWSWAGLFGILTPLVIISFYSVVGGWCIQYFFKACTFQFSDVGGSAQMHDMFTALVSSVWPSLVGFLIFLTISLWIVDRGVKDGIEKFGKWTMPALFVIIVLIAVYVMMLPGASDGYRWLFKPDFSAITPRVFTIALGQSFFSLSLGCGCMVTYASYIDKNDDLFRHCTNTALLDVGFAVISACAIIPAVFAYGINPASGPSLLYEALPYIFSRMPAGNFVGMVFFFALLIAVFTSMISMVEPVTAALVEEVGVSRRKAVVIIFLFTVVFGSLCSLSFGPLSGMKMFGMNLFDLFDSVSSDFLMIFGALAIVIFVGWKMKKEDVRDELTMGGKRHGRVFGIFYFILRYIAPIIILFIFIAGLLNTI